MLRLRHSYGGAPVPDQLIPQESTPDLRTQSPRKPVVAGILNIVAGAVGIMASFGGCMNVVNAGRTQDAWLILLAIPGTFALIGGIYARRRKQWPLAFVGSLCAIPAVLGIVSTALTVLSKKEFE